MINPGMNSFGTPFNPGGGFNGNPMNGGFPQQPNMGFQQPGFTGQPNNTGFQQPGFTGQPNNSGSQQGGFPQGFQQGWTPNNWYTSQIAPPVVQNPPLQPFQNPPNPVTGGIYNNAYFPPMFPPSTAGADFAYALPPGLSAAFSGNTNAMIFGILGIQPRIDDAQTITTGPAFNTFIRPPYPYPGVLGVPGFTG